MGIHTCCCEVDYSRSLLDLFINKNLALDEDYKHPTFDYDANCRGSGPNGHQRDCCGTYPKRRMYSINTKECCHETNIYDPMLQVCCADGQIQYSDQDCSI